MHRRDNLAHLILAGVIVLGLMLLMVCVEAQARIAFASDRDGNYEIYVMTADGGDLRRLTNNRATDHSPSWSPDGKRIVFMSARDGHIDANHGSPTFEIYVMAADGSNPRNLTNNPHYDMSPSWSPDGKQIVFASLSRFALDEDPALYFDIYVMAADGGNPHNLTNSPNDDRFPSWSPDGGQIVFSARRDGHFENEHAITYEIYVMEADGMNQQRLTENRSNDWDPVWSPDGNRIAFASDRKGDLQNFEIYVMDADGGNEQKLTENRENDRFPSWSPDGERIVFASERDGNWESLEIYVMDADGGNPQNLTNNPQADVGPAWLNSPFSVSPSGKRFTMWGRLKQVDR